AMDACSPVRLCPDSNDLCVFLQASTRVAGLHVPGGASVQGVSLPGSDASVARGEPAPISGSRGGRQAGSTERRRSVIGFRRIIWDSIPDTVCANNPGTCRG